MALGEKMGHYLSEMANYDLVVEIEKLLKGMGGYDDIILKNSKGRKLRIKANDLRQLLAQRKNAINDLREVRSLFRKLSRL